MPSLDEMAAACQIPGKLDHSGSGVLELWLRGDYAALTGYNETDACTTYLLWLRTAWFLGRLTPMQRDEEVRTFRLLLQKLAPTKPHFGRFLQVWQARLGTDADDEMHALGQRVANAAQSNTIVVEATCLPSAAADGTRTAASTCEIKLNLTDLDEAALARIKPHLVATGNKRFRLCQLGCDQDGNRVVGRDASGRLLMLSQPANADYRRKRRRITSNLVFSQWDKIFKDPA